MNCDVCQNKTASVFYSHLADGKLQKVKLCEECAEEKGVTDPTSYSIGESLGDVGEKTTTVKPAAPDELVCGHCGFTHTDFKKTGRFGCAECYDVFDEGLDGLLEAMHKHTEHCGKVPTCVSLRKRGQKPKEEKEPVTETPPVSEPSTPEEKMAILRESLEASVEAEDYEEAARLRDAISQMESRLDD